MEQAEPRLVIFDVLRGIGILCVIWGHLRGGGTYTYWVYVMHMPLFFIISGYFLSARQPYNVFFLKKCRGLLIPYLKACVCFCTLSVLKSLVTERPIMPSLLKWLGGSVYGAGSVMPVPTLILPRQQAFIGAVWFLLALFWAMLLTRKVIDLHLPFLNGLMAVLMLAYVGWATSSKVWLPWNIQAGLVASIYIYIGFWLKRTQLLEQKPSLMFLLLCVLIVLWCFKYYKGVWLVRNYFGNGWMDVLGGFACFYLLFVVTRRFLMSCSLTRLLSWLGKNSLIVLTLHVIETFMFPWSSVQALFVKHGMTGLNYLLPVFTMKVLWCAVGILIVSRYRRGEVRKNI